MNRKMIFYTTGQLLLLEAILLLLPLIVAAVYRESTLPAFCVSIAAALFLGLSFILLSHPKSRNIYAKEGFIITTLTWLLVSAIGALPFYISGEIPSYIDAFFESVSGFTTTGASILEDVEAMSRGLLFWRSFTHWIGGMGVIVLMMALLPSDGKSGRAMHIMRAEMPGPVVGKLVPRVRETAKILYLIYLGITVLQTVFLLAGGMPLFDSLVHAFATTGTGGFGIKADSVASYSPYLQWVITVFMLLCGINFNLYYLLLIRSYRSALRSTELWCYLGIITAASAIITANILPLYQGIGQSVRLAVFQVVSVITTTGFATADFNLWPGLSRGVLFLLMFVGACAGSTGGGMKISRVVILLRSARHNLSKMLHPRSVHVVRFEGKAVERTTLDGLSTYLTLYFMIICTGFLILCLEPMSFETNLTAIITCFNNVGPGFSTIGPAGTGFDAVGPAASFAAYSPLGKMVLSAAMLLGRLEIFPLLLAFSPSTWTKK